MHDNKFIVATNYLGSKFSVLNWLLPLLPRTNSFIDLFGGSASVILNKPPTSLETYNDLNRNVVNFFKVLRDQPDDFIRLLHLTPHSRSEYDEAWYNETDSDLEKARKFFVRCRQSFLATGIQNEKKGWDAATKQSRCLISESTNKWLKGVERLHNVVSRLKTIQIENRDYREIVALYDTPETLFYADPPYDPEKRSGRWDYEHEFTVDDHVELRDIARTVKGKFAVSGYDSVFMKELWKDFHYTPGPRRKNNYSNKDIRECLWSNYNPFLVNNNTLFS